jgi:hypothetical protein
VRGGDVRHGRIFPDANDTSVVAYRAFGRFVFAFDPDPVLVEFVEPAASRR